MRILDTTVMPESEMDKLWVYNGLDCMITREVFDVIEPQLTNITRSTYEFSKSLQAPVLEMRLRGIKVDLRKRDDVIRDFQERLGVVQAGLNRVLTEGLAHPNLNWRSHQQLKAFFYDYLKLPAKRKRAADGTYQPTVNREALEKLQDHFVAQPLIKNILACRDIAKKIGVLRTEIDPDGRIRTSYNIAGTNTGRFSSSFNDFGTGTNLQNIEKRLREIFVADPGMKFAQLDAEQGESRVVGAIEWNRFKDPTYLDACESGDLHTAVCRLAWPNLQWTGDLRSDRAIADLPFYRQHSYRHMAKVLGHGTNYNGQPATMAEHTKLDVSIIKEFQPRYFASFPAHIRWHVGVATDLGRDGFLVSLLGRKRYFMGRLSDPATVREAIAFDPQSSLGDLLNRGMLAVWRSNTVQVLAQIHDAILVQYPEEVEDEVLPKIRKLIEVPIELQHGRSLLIPYEIKTGWNWGEQSKENIDGLAKYKPGDTRHRVEEVRGLD